MCSKHVHAVGLLWLIILLLLSQTKYKKAGKNVSSSLYSVMPETMETQHAKQASLLQSQVLTTHTYCICTHTHTHTHLHTHFEKIFYCYMGCCPLSPNRMIVVIAVLGEKWFCIFWLPHTLSHFCLSSLTPTLFLLSLFSLHVVSLPLSCLSLSLVSRWGTRRGVRRTTTRPCSPPCQRPLRPSWPRSWHRSEEHTSELQSR